MKKAAQQGIIDPKIIIGGVIVAVVAFFVATGNFKFSGSVGNKQTSTTPAPGQSIPSQPSSTTKTYENQTYGMKLEYPDGWSMKENPASGIIVAFRSPKENSSDKFVDNVNVSNADISSKPNMTLMQLTDSWLKQTESAPSFKLQDRKSTTLAGEAAEQIVYTFTSNGMDLKGMVVITMKNKMAYIITYTAEKTSYDKFENAANTIVSSLQVN